MSDSGRTPLAEVIDLLVVGEPLPFHVLDPQERRLLAQGHVVVGLTQLEMLIARGAWVDRELAAELRRSRGGAADAAAPVPARVLTLFDRWEQMIWTLDAALRRVLAGQPAQAPLDALADEVLARVQRHPDVAIYLVVRPQDARYALYALQHALHTATIGCLLARQLGWPDAQTRQLVLAALTMNVSTLELQAQMAAQADPPTVRQREAIRAHPQASESLLRAAGVLDEVWLRAVREHHERSDGSGYPRGQTVVGDLAQALRTVDVFTAKISARAIRQALPIQSAAKQLFQEEKGGPLATGLIKAIGLYPPGDLVLLKNGEVAVVTHKGGNATTPRVAAITNASGQPVAATVPRDTAQPEFAVTGPVLERKGLPRVPAERVYGLLPPD